MAGVNFRKSGGGASGGSHGIWLVGVTQSGGTFLTTLKGTPEAGEVTSITSFSTDGTSVTLTLIADRGVDYEPVVKVNGVTATRDSTNTTSASLDGTFKWTVTVPVTTSLVLTTSDGTVTSIPVQTESPAIVTNLTIINNPTSTGTNFYRNSQTELKQGDEVYVTFQTDKPIISVRGVTLSSTNCVSAFTYSGGNLTYDAPTDTYTAILTIGRLATVPANISIQINTETLLGAVSSIPATTSNTIQCNNLYPSIILNSIAYPTTQQALKNAEVATINTTISNQDSFTFETPLSQLNQVVPADSDSVRDFARVAGTYNVSTPNINVTATKDSNDSVTVLPIIVFIANVPPLIGATAGPVALRSGGNDGTNSQPYTVTVTSSQRLTQAPTLNMTVGTPQNSGFTWDTTSVLFTRSLHIHDLDARGTANFNTLTATGLSGLVTTTFNGSSTQDYEISGFVQRNITLPAFLFEAPINVLITDETKVAVHWQFTSKNLTRSLTETRPTTNGFFIRNPTSNNPIIVLLDQSSTDASSQDSIVEIQET